MWRREAFYGPKRSRCDIAVELTIGRHVRAKMQRLIFPFARLAQAGAKAYASQAREARQEDTVNQPRDLLGYQAQSR